MELKPSDDGAAVNGSEVEHRGERNGEKENSHLQLYDAGFSPVEPTVELENPEFKRPARMPSDEVQSPQEPHFDLGVPVPGRWTCNLCQDNFPLFQVSVGYHVYQCLKTRHGGGLESGNTTAEKFTDIAQRVVGSKTTTSRPRKRKSNTLHPRKWKCQYCGLSLFARSALTRHKLIHHPILYQPLPCPKCKNNYPDETSLRVHLQRCKGPTVKVKAEVEVVMAVEQLSCSRDSLKLGSKSEFRNHLETHGDSNHCLICCAEFSSKALLAEHRNVHPPNLDSFQCTICKKLLSSKAILRLHIRLCINSIIRDVSGEKKCSICSKTFTSKYILRHHYKRHYPRLVESTPKCSKCGRVFYSKYSLSVHVAKVCGRNKKETVVKPKPEDGICKICNKDVPNLGKHMHIHARAQGIHFCKSCPAKYAQSVSLRRHMKRFHGTPVESVSAVKPVTASSGKGAVSKLKGSSSPKKNPGLNTKNESVTGQIFKCGKCPKEFFTDRNRKAHEFIHSLQKTFSCPHCDREFSLKGNMTRHVASCHA